MKILGIDAVTPFPGVALRIDGQNAVARAASRRFSTIVNERKEFLLPMIDEVLRDGGLGVGDLDGVALIIGPGSYTGIRIGIAMVQGLLLDRKVRALPVSSFDALEAWAGDGFVPAIRIRRTEWVARFGGAVLSLDETEWSEFSRTHRCVLAGAADDARAKVLEQSLASCAAAFAERGTVGGVAGSELRPLYGGGTYAQLSV